jgi:hypothetical protein
VNQITPKRLTNSGLIFVKAFKACCLFIKFSKFRTHHQKIKKIPHCSTFKAPPPAHLPLRLKPLPLPRGENRENQKRLLFNGFAPFEGGCPIGLGGVF